MSFRFNFKKICSKKTKEIPCLKDMSLSDTGWSLLKLAKSANAITAYRPLEVSFILPFVLLDIYNLD